MDEPDKECCDKCGENVTPLYEESEWHDHLVFAICPFCNSTIKRFYEYRHQRDDDDSESSS